MIRPLQIRQVARLRSTTCNLQGLSPTQRSTQTTPSRNQTLGVMQVPWLELESTNPLQSSRTTRGERTRELVSTSLGGSLFREWTQPFPGEPIPSGCGCSSHPPCPRGKFLDRHEHACSTNTSRHDTSRHTASCRPRCKSLHRNRHACRTDAGTHAT